MQFTVIDEIKNLLTTTSLILDRINSTGRPPIDGQRQLLAGPESVAPAGVLGLHDPPLRVSPGAQVDGAVLLVAQISKSVQPSLVCAVLGVVVVDEPQIILEDLEPPLMLSQVVVGFPVLGQPRVVDAHHLGVAPPGWLVVAVVVADDGHIGGR